MRCPETEVVQHLDRLFRFGTAAGMSDAELIRCFVCERGESAEHAFEALVERHGPMVLRVCRSVVGDRHSAEDAFQASFMVLARKARSVAVKDSLASWLCSVAYRVASKARTTAARRVRRECEVAAGGFAIADPACLSDDLAILGEEVNLLPPSLRAAVVLCYLEGKTYDQAAESLKVTGSTVRGRLTRARERLRARLVRRGVILSIEALLAHAIDRSAREVCSQALVRSTSQAALAVAAGHAAASGGASISVAALTEGVLTSMLLTKLKTALVWTSVGVVAFSACVLARQSGAPVAQEGQVTTGRPSPADPVADAARGAPAGPHANAPGYADPPATPDVVARVGGVDITREELIAACLARHGTAELEKLINRRVLENACKERGIRVTMAELAAGMAEHAKGLNMAVRDFERMLKDQKGMPIEDFRDNVLYPHIALKKLAGDSKDEQGLFFERLRLFANIQVFFGDKAGASSGQPTAERGPDRDRRLDDLERKVDRILQRLEGAGRAGEPPSR
jgi:RNA polymerase sigma factor (sigma-70 family)